MTNQALAPVPIGGRQPSPEALMEVLANGNIDGLSGEQKLAYLEALCRSLGLNHLSRPFQYLKLNNKTTLYATKDCTEQLRKIHGVSTKLVDQREFKGVWLVTAQATDKHGRTDESVGAVPIESLKGEALANALMKAETKSKRRVTLSICGLGMLDESELDTLPDAQRVRIEEEPRPRSSPDDLYPPESNGRPAPRPDRPSPPVAQASAIPPADDTAERKHFWGEAKRLGYPNQVAVHTAFGLGPEAGALKAHMSRHKLSWPELEELLTAIGPYEAHADDLDSLPLASCPQCGRNDAWADEGCTACGWQAPPASIDDPEPGLPGFEQRAYHDDARGRR